MIKTLTVTNHLDESIIIDLKNPAPSGFFIRGIDGLGPPKAVINLTEVLSMDGAFFNSARVTNRNVVIHLGFYNDGALSIEDIRRKTYRYFPIKKQVHLRIESDNRIVNTVGFVESNEPNIFSKDEQTDISILCPDAYLFGDEVVQTIFSGYIPLFEFPFENPSLTEPLIVMGDIVLETEQTVFYEGDAETGVIVSVYFLGDVNDLHIYNLTRGQLMAIDSAKLVALTGSDFILGDRLVISTIRGNKYIHLIRAGVTINILNTLDADAEWFTLEYGDNLFLFEAGTGVNNIQFMIQHQILYEGI
jgi:phage-related protein